MDIEKKKEAVNSIRKEIANKAVEIKDALDYLIDYEPGIDEENWGNTPEGLLATKALIKVAQDAIMLCDAMMIKEEDEENSQPLEIVSYIATGNLVIELISLAISDAQIDKHQDEDFI